MRNYDAVIAGYLGVDIICDFKSGQVFKQMMPGKLLEMDDIGFALGGVVANTGMAMKKFGKNVYLNGLLGDDLLGKMAKERLEGYDLSEGINITTSAKTACGIVISPVGVDRMFLEYPGCNEIFDLSHIDFGIIGRSRLFHFGYPPLLKQFYRDNGFQLSEMFSRIKKAGVITSLDFSLPDTESESGKVDWPAVLGNTLPHVDIFVPSVEEAIQIVMPEIYAQLQQSNDGIDFVDKVSFELMQEAGRRILEFGVKILLIKLAHRGAYLLTADVSSITERGNVCSDSKWNYCELTCEAYPPDHAKIRNASGAGDTAAAAFLSAILDDESPDAAIRFATMAGRNNLYCFEIYEELSDWPTMKNEINTEGRKVTEYII